MKTILTTILFALSIQTFALDMKSKIAVDATGEIQKYLEVTCGTNEKNFCQQLCSDSTSCRIPENLCQDCVTQKSQMMYSIFTDINTIFKSDIMFVENQQLLTFLKNKKFISIPHDLFINMFTPEKKDALKNEFEKLCQIRVQSATLLATVNEDNQADQLVGVICQDTMGSVVLPISLNPAFTNQQVDFWENLNAQIGQTTDGLKLKLTTEFGTSTAQENTYKVTDFSVSTEKSHINRTQTNLQTELSQSSVCKIRTYTDGTSPVINAELYKKCMNNKK